MDVFRTPKNSMLLSVFSGIGIQIVHMINFSLLITLFGIDSEENRGSFLTSLIVCYFFMGALAGYFASRIYKMFGVN